MSILDRAPRPERRRLKRMIHRSRDVDEVRRATAILNLMEGATVAETATLLVAARSTVYRWAGGYRAGGLEALRSAPRGRPETTVTDELVGALIALLREPPQAHGYLRSTWSSELLDHVSRFLQAAQPFPGSGHGVAQFGSAI